MKAEVKKIAKMVLGEQVYNGMRVKKINRNMDEAVLENRLRNKKYCDEYLNKRCFILGNGPSLKTVDLSTLGEEYVFSVNNFGSVENYELAKPNFHLWADLSFFCMREDQKYDIDDLLDNYRRIEKVSPVCFVPDVASKFIIKNELDKKLDIHYFTGFDVVNESEPIRYDISQPITGFTTVVQYAVIIAMYMGFKEIYLLGCDSTNIVSVLNCAMNVTNENMHAYKNDDVNERYRELLKKWTMTEVFFDQYKLFLGYKMLYEKCESLGIKLVNCSSSTIINELPLKRLEEVL